MDTHELAGALKAAGVDPDKYLLLPLEKQPFRWSLRWELRPAGSVWLSGTLLGWSVGAGGIGPHYHAEGDLRRFGSEDEACEVFLRELTSGREPFAEEKAQFGLECLRAWWEGEVRLALDEPAIGAERARWRATWRQREAAGQPSMTVEELDATLRRLGRRLPGMQLQGLDDLAMPEDERGVVLRRDDQGRWFWGFWNDERPGLLLPEYRFDTEGEACQSFFHEFNGPQTMTAALTLKQWRQTKEVVRENLAAKVRYDEEKQQRLDAQIPADSGALALRLYNRGVPAERIQVSGFQWGFIEGYQVSPDAVYLVLDEGDGRWRIKDAAARVRREFTSQDEAFAAYEREMLGGSQEDAVITGW